MPREIFDPVSTLFIITIIVSGYPIYILINYLESKEK